MTWKVVDDQKTGPEPSQDDPELVAVGRARALSLVGAAELVLWLSDHEDDIADGVNDFGDLARVFKFVFGRVPES